MRPATLLLTATLLFLPSRLPAPTHETASCPTDGYARRPFEDQLDALGALTAPLEAVGYPADFSPDAIVAWQKNLRAAQRQTYDNLTAAMKTAEGKKALETVVQALIDDWQRADEPQSDGSVFRHYPTGTSPQVWNPVRERCKTVDGFFDWIGTDPDIVQHIANTLLSKMTLRQYGITQRSRVDEILYFTRLSYAFRVVAEARVGKRVVDKSNYDGIPTPVPAQGAE